MGESQRTVSSKASPPGNLPVAEEVELVGALAQRPDEVGDHVLGLVHPT